jgi:heptosyltransferase-2
MSLRIAVLTPNWLGDAAMALPALGAVRQHFSQDTLVVAARASLSALFGMVTGVDEVVSLGAGGGWRGGRPWASDVRALAGARADIALLLPNSFRSAWIARQAGVPERWGFVADWRGRLLTRRVARPRGRLHQADYYRALTAGLGMSPAPDRCRVEVPIGAKQRAHTLLREIGVGPDDPVVGIAPGAAYGHAKQWPPDYYARLVRLLHTRLGVVSVLVGSLGDRPAGDQILASLSESHSGGRPSFDAVRSLIARTDLAALAGVLVRCRAFVSNDSGAAHLAAAVGLPVTVIFGASDERGTAPLPVTSPSTPLHEILTCRVWCRPCMLRECPIDHRCMLGVDPESVAGAVARQIGAA